MEQDYAEAARLLRKAARMGHANAQFELGLMYAKGFGEDENRSREEAVKWWRRSAAQGHEGAKKALEALGVS